MTRRVSTTLSNQSTHPHQARPLQTRQPARTPRPRPPTQTPRPTTPPPRPPTPPLSSTPTSLEEGAPKVRLISGTPLAPNSEGLLQEHISGAPPRELLGTISELADLPAPPYYTIHPSTYLVRLSLMMVGQEDPRGTHNTTRVVLSFTRAVPSGVLTTQGGPRRREAPW